MSAPGGKHNWPAAVSVLAGAGLLAAGSVLAGVNARSLAGTIVFLALAAGILAGAVLIVVHETRRDR